MAKIDREAIGTMPCSHCGGVRSIHETGKGTRKGMLYTRCPTCTERKHKCIQKVDSVYQAEIRANATWREGFERYGEPLEPVAPVGEPQEPQKKPKVAANADPETDPKPTPNRSGLGALMAGAAGLSLILFGVLKR